MRFPSERSGSNFGGSRPASTRRGWVSVERVRGRSEIVRLFSESPLRLLAPKSAGDDAAWIVAGSYGGGLLGGDHLAIDVRCGAGTRALLGTQATTKVYRQRRDSGHREQRWQESASQWLDVSLADGATAVYWPDPVTCFAGSRYEQRQRFELHPSASLAAVDWLTSGRMARGESWAFDRFSSRTEIIVNGRLAANEALRLDPADGDLRSVSRVATFECLGMAWLVGPAFSDASTSMLARLARKPIDPRPPVQFAVSPLSFDGQANGAVLRFAARSTESAWRWLRGAMTDVLSVIGVDPWARRG